LSVDLVKDIYKITINYPDEEKFGIVSQLRRAAVSISSNLAEGSSRISYKDKAHFTQISFGSLMELLCQMIISEELGYIDEKQLLKIREKIEEISNKLNSLRNYQLNK
jgi:four helix bundle protein